jgi:hypothetical protein
MSADWGVHGTDSYPLSRGGVPPSDGDGLMPAFCARWLRRRRQRYHTPAAMAANPATVDPATTPAITPALRAAPLLNFGAKLGRKVPTDSGEPPKSQAVMLSQGSEGVTFRKAQAGIRVSLFIASGNLRFFLVSRATVPQNVARRTLTSRRANRNWQSIDRRSTKSPSDNQHMR